ncbi:MAG: transcription antitermination factor NusB [Angelakisella sp.]
MKTARETAATALLSVFSQGGYSNIVLDNILEKEDLSSQDRSFCAALFYGVAERVLTLDYAIAAYCKSPLKKLSPAVLTCLRCGFYQLLYMPSVPQSAAVNETVTVVKQLGETQAAGLVNGILRSFVRANLTYPEPKDKLTALSIKYSVPMPLIQLWRKGYGQEATLRILEGISTVPPLFVRVNTTRTTADVLVETLAAEGVEAHHCETSTASKCHRQHCKACCLPAGSVPCAGPGKPALRRCGCARRRYADTGCLRRPRGQKFYHGRTCREQRQPYLL